MLEKMLQTLLFRFCESQRLARCDRRDLRNQQFTSNKRTSFELKIRQFSSGRFFAFGRFFFPFGFGFGMSALGGGVLNFRIHFPAHHKCQASHIEP